MMFKENNGNAFIMKCYANYEFQVYMANLSHVLEVAYIAIYVNLLWDPWGAFLHTSLGLSRRRFLQELDDHSVAAINA